MAIWSKLKHAIARGSESKAPCCVYSVEMKGTSGLQGTLTRLSPAGEFSQSAIDREGRQVAFWGSEPGCTGHHLWVADIASHSCKQITQQPGLHGHPAWWPDGKSLVYFSTAGVSDSLSWEAARQFSPRRPSANLFRIEIATGERTQLTNGDWVDERPAVSPSGKEIVFVSNRSGKLNLWALDVGSTELRQVTRNSDLDYRPSFSPDGSRIAYFTQTDAGSHQLAIVQWPDVAPLEIDTGKEFIWAHGPSWCGTSNGLLFHALRRNEKRPALWLIDIDTTNTQRLELPGIKDCSHGSLSRSDSHLAFDSRERTRYSTPTVLE